jgi:thiamine kinase-like enzyme
MSTTIESVLAQIPDWERATYRELPGGLSNHTLLVETAGRRAVLKIDDTPREAPYNCRQSEAQVQSSASEKNLASPVLFVNDTTYMTEYLEGDVWSSASLDDDRNLGDLAVALRKLHGLPLTGRIFDAAGAAQGYVRRIENADRDEVSKFAQVIKARALPQQLCCCHNDLVAANIISTPGVRFLDWEYACDNDPLFDLATVVAHHKLSAERSDYLLNAYFDGDGQQWREKLAVQVNIYEALLWLWEAARQ